MKSVWRGLGKKKGAGMRRMVGLGLVVGLAACGTAGLVLYAQSVPLTVHVAWDPEPAVLAVTGYTVTLDGGSPLSVPANACGPQVCSTPLVIGTTGPHSINVTATNLDAFGTPQTGAPAVLPFTVQPKPGAVTNVKVTP